MPGRYIIELEPEVQGWLETLTLAEYAKVEATADILADNADTRFVESRSPHGGR